MQHLTTVQETPDEGYPNSSRRYPHSQRHTSNIVRSPGRVHSTRVGSSDIPDEFQHAQEKISPSLAIGSRSKVKSLTSSPTNSMVFPVPNLGKNLENIRSPKSSLIYDTASMSPNNRSPQNGTVMLNLKDKKFGLNEGNIGVPKRPANVNINVEANENDWKSIGGSNNVDEEMEKVRKLEAWQLSMIKDKSEKKNYY